MINKHIYYEMVNLDKALRVERLVNYIHSELSGKDKETLYDLLYEFADIEQRSRLTDITTEAEALNHKVHTTYPGKIVNVFEKVISERV